ncbi:flagellar basal body-associated FliL family protein [Oceaniglobus ichthyenteri]|uniref:flagellar basal body-associated FliL family protein n=1 Tax=Oceaniglobus ichthyenteri TaxID=2136177 RepID=UPI000D347370|nr:flagellar basal body-associated FliL family protein [Oceaniglobus ichthyenteri]
MLGKLIPLIIAIIGLAAGVGAGFVLRPGPEPAVANTALAENVEIAEVVQKPPAEQKPRASEFIALNNQFVFPLIEDGRVSSLVALSITLEVSPDQKDAVYIREPKLRDGFLRVLLDHANAGGFDGAFTSNEAMGALRRALLEKGREDMGDALYDILILDINRQDT